MLDTHIVLDLFVFRDEAAQPLLPALHEGRLRWFATGPMRDELARVLGYPQLLPRLASRGRVAAHVLAAFDRHAMLTGVPPKAPLTCADPDDQKFIDLAVARGGWLLSKDKAVLSMQKRLAALSVQAQRAIDLEALT